MPAIKEYLEALKDLLDNIPFKLSEKIQVKNRGDVVLYINGEIVFTDNSELHFKEYPIAISFLRKLAYSYHYQNKSNKLIFRFGNAGHHPEIRTYPHHKHIKNTVLQSKETLDEMMSLLLKGTKTET